MAKSQKAGSRSPSLALITVSFVIASILVGAILAFKVINDRVRSFQEAGLRTVVETRAHGVQTAFSQSLYREWTNLEALATPLAVGEPEEVQDELTLLVGNGKVVSWAGFATNDGVVRVASNGLLVGASVAARPWFQRGLQGRFAGDAHEAVLLSSKLPPPPSGEPLRFLDLATPIRGVGDSVSGVLGLHLNLEWAKTQIQQLAAALDIDVFIVNPEGKVIISSVEGEYSNLDLASFRTARAGASGVNVETWPDGRLYYTATLPEASYPNLPKFGWGIIARIGADAVTQPARSFSTGLVFNLAIFGLLLLLLTLLFIVAFIRPFDQLARNATAIANGEDVYPYESSRTSELALIGSALARLQSQASREDGGTPPHSRAGEVSGG